MPHTTTQRRPLTADQRFERNLLRITAAVWLAIGVRFALHVAGIA